MNVDLVRLERIKQRYLDQTSFDFSSGVVVEQMWSDFQFTIAECEKLTARNKAVETHLTLFCKCNDHGGAKVESEK